MKKQKLQGCWPILVHYCIYYIFTSRRPTGLYYIDYCIFILIVRPSYQYWCGDSSSIRIKLNLPGSGIHYTSSNRIGSLVHVTLCYYQTPQVDWSNHWANPQIPQIQILLSPLFCYRLFSHPAIQAIIVVRLEPLGAANPFCSLHAPPHRYITQTASFIKSNHYTQNLLFTLHNQLLGLSITILIVTKSLCAKLVMSHTFRVVTATILCGPCCPV